VPLSTLWLAFLPTMVDRAVGFARSLTRSLTRSLQPPSAERERERAMKVRRSDRRGQADVEKEIRSLRAAAWTGVRGRGTTHSPRSLSLSLSIPRRRITRRDLDPRRMRITQSAHRASRIALFPSRLCAAPLLGVAVACRVAVVVLVCDLTADTVTPRIG